MTPRPIMTFAGFCKYLYSKPMNNLRTVARWAIMLVTAATLLCGIAAADSIVVTGVNGNLGEYGVWIEEYGQDVDTYFAGVINIQLTDTAGVFNRDTMCVQLFTDIYIGETYGTTVVTPNQDGGGALDQASWLLDNALMPAQDGTPSVLPSVDWVTTAAQGAGLQLAIWDLVEDGGDGFSKGSVQASTGANGPATDATTLYWANLYEAAVEASSSYVSNDAFVYENSSNGVQAQTLEGPEYLYDGGPQPPATTPEAPTLVLAGMALTVLGLAGRHKLGMLGSRSAKL